MGLKESRDRQRLGRSGSGDLAGQVRHAGRRVWFHYHDGGDPTADADDCQGTPSPGGAPGRVKPELVATKPNVCWSWDITKLHGPAKWTYYYPYVIIDIYSRYVVGWLIADAESKVLAEKLLADTIDKQNINRNQLTIHADNGSSMASKPVAFLLADLGVADNALEQLDAAQLVFDAHPRLRDGRCGGCGGYRCRTYAAAQSVFARYGRLPRRRLVRSGAGAPP